MEVKKAHKADLEKTRLTGFLLGLILALSLMFVAFEYTSRDEQADDDQKALDDMNLDAEEIPLAQQKNMIAAAAPRRVKTVSDKIKVVDNTDAEQPDIMDKGNENQSNSQGQGQSEGKDTNTSDETTALSPVATDLDDNPLNFKIVEELPDFPGGMVEFMKWLTKNLRYPSDAQTRKIQGKVIVQFIVNKDGTTVDSKVIQSLDPSCDREALRVLRMMPKWKPGTEHGKVVRTKFCIPIVFKL